MAFQVEKHGQIKMDFPTFSYEENHDFVKILFEIELKYIVSGQKKVVWPPVPETNGYHQPQQVIIKEIFPISIQHKGQN